MPRDPKHSGDRRDYAADAAAQALAAMLQGRSFTMRSDRVLTCWLETDRGSDDPQELEDLVNIAEGAGRRLLARFYGD